METVSAIMLKAWQNLDTHYSTYSILHFFFWGSKSSRLNISSNKIMTRLIIGMNYIN